MDNLDFVVKICKAEKNLTNNCFYNICDRYGLSVEQIKQALALVNGLSKVQEGFVKSTRRRTKMKEEKITQQQCVLNWWKEHKYISSIESFSSLYIVDLQGVIRNLKEKGYNIASKWVYTHNIYGKPVKYKRYWLEKGE